MLSPARKKERIREMRLKARKTRFGQVVARLNPRATCRTCIGRKYCCVHFKIRNADYQDSATTKHSDNVEAREKVCVCGRCRDAVIMLVAAEVRPRRRRPPA